MRSDTRRNQDRMMDAVRDIAREGDGGLTMQAIASRAEIGAATAYRYYSTVDEVLSSYTHRVVLQLSAFAEGCSATGARHFDAVLSEWMDLLEQHGPAMVRLRSHRGFLERLRSGDPIIKTWAEAWSDAVCHLLGDVGLPDDQLEYALFLCNLILDPREIGDLRAQTDLSEHEIKARLTQALLGAVLSWIEVDRD